MPPRVISMTLHAALLFASQIGGNNLHGQYAATIF